MFGFAQPARIFLLIAVCCSAAYADMHPNRLASIAAVDAVEIPHIRPAPESQWSEGSWLQLASLQSNVVTRDIDAAKPREPFGLPASRAPDASMSAKWSDLQSRMSDDAKAIAACRSDEASCSPAARRFLEIVDIGHKHEGRARLGWINRVVNLGIVATSDLEQYGFADFWASPLQTLGSGSGDCEDYAILKYAVLRELGFESGDLRFVIVRDKLRDMDHAVVAVRDAQDWLLLDNRTMAILSADDARHYEALLNLDEKGAHVITAAAADQVKDR